MKLRPKTKWFWWVFLICVLPRIILVIVNDECNDDHMTPIMLLQEKGVYPETHDCWECFQPPLFYYTINAIASPLNINQWMDLYYLIQIFNLFFVLAILWIILRIVESFKLPKLLSVSSMLFFGLNPELISIGALATNDTVMIFTGFVLIYLFMKQWHNPTVSKELTIATIISLAAITKGNALVFGFAFAVLLLLIYTRDRSWNIKSLSRQLVLAVVMFFFVGYFGNYFEKHQKLGYAFTINQDKQGPPHFFETDYYLSVGRPGVITIYDTYFKMQFLSLLEQPYIINDGPNYPKHRTSFWGQLYGQYSNYMFERYPASWVSDNNDHYNFTRTNYVLHLPILFLLILGIISAIRSQRQGLNFNLVHVFLAALFLFFIARYSYIYRDFSNMKVIFFFPILYSLMVLFLNYIKKIRFQKVVSYLLLASSLLYQVSFVYLIIELIK